MQCLEDEFYQMLQEAWEMTSTSQRTGLSKKYSQDMLLNAFNSARNNREEIMAGEICGCFSCKNVFRTYEIDCWITGETGDTAICPYCFIEAVIGEKSGYPITGDFLAEMNEHWYDKKLCERWDWWLYTDL